jgi:ribosome maturation factor RimP
MNKMVRIVTELARPVCEKHGCELWDAEYVKDAGVWYLRVIIDRPGGVSTEHCEAVSRELNPALDEYEQSMPDNYIFEVASAGAERQLRRPSDFERFIGSCVQIKLYKARGGEKEFMGVLRGYDGGDVEIDAGGKTQKFEKSEIANVRLKIAQGGEDISEYQEAE